MKNKKAVKVAAASKATTKKETKTTKKMATVAKKSPAKKSTKVLKLQINQHYKVAILILFMLKN